MATTQQQIDLRTAKDAAREIGLNCQIEATGDDYTITMETGEVETVTGLPGALRVIGEYAAALPKVTVSGHRVAYDAAVNLMDDELREQLHTDAASAIAWHYNTPVESAGWIYDEAKLAEIRSADPSLIKEKNQAFVDLYAEAHQAKFGEAFTVS